MIRGDAPSRRNFGSSLGWQFALTSPVASPMASSVVGSMVRADALPQRGFVPAVCGANLLHRPAICAAAGSGTELDWQDWFFPRQAKTEEQRKQYITNRE